MNFLICLLQYVLNLWLDQVTNCKITEDFYLFQVRDGKGGTVEYGVHFVSPHHATTFAQCFDVCISQLANASSMGSEAQPNSPRGTRSRSLSYHQTRSFADLLISKEPSPNLRNSSYDAA